VRIQLTVQVPKITIQGF